MFGHSTRGYQHITANTGCQDRHKAILLPDGTCVLAVADGHGSKACPYSDMGAWAACKAFCLVMRRLSESCDSNQTLFSLLNREGAHGIARSIVYEWRRYIRRSYKSRKLSMPKRQDGSKDFDTMYRSAGTTLLGAVITANWYFAFQIGDGDIYLVAQSGCEPLVQANKYAGVETDSLCSSDAWNSVVCDTRRWRITEPTILMMTTDGFYNSHISDAEYKRSCIAYLKALEEYGTDSVRDNLPQWLNETSRNGCGDDITLLLAYLRPE